MKQRIWELDALRGLCILGMVVVHFIYDLTSLYRLVSWQVSGWFMWVQEWGGVLFLLISGICVTLGSRCLRRGFTVFSCGMVCTLVTLGLVLFGNAQESMIIWFGVLHCLGACMLLWPAFRRLPAWALLPTGILLAALGHYLSANVRVDFPWLIPFGVLMPGFSSADYFPLLPNLGYFLVGAWLGQTVYGKKQSLLPWANRANPFIRFLLLCGKNSLWIYLLHQPVLTAIFSAVSFISQ